MEQLEAKSERELLIMVIDRLNTVCLDVKTQNERIRKLEDWRTYLAGGMTVIAFLVPFLLWVIAQRF